jgi:hypothetical protein
LPDGVVGRNRIDPTGGFVRGVYRKSTEPIQAAL